MESDNIIILLNANYKIAEFQGGAVGELEFAKYHTDNFTIKRNKDIIYITIKNDQSIFYEDNCFYKIYIQWYGGWVESLSRFNNGKFIIEDEDYFNKGPF